jgi:hypothetical protein
MLLVSFDASPAASRGNLFLFILEFESWFWILIQVAEGVHEIRCFFICDELIILFLSEINLIFTARKQSFENCQAKCVVLAHFERIQRKNKNQCCIVIILYSPSQLFLFTGSKTLPSSEADSLRQTEGLYHKIEAHGADSARLVISEWHE